MTTAIYKEITDYIRSLYPDENPVPLHAPRFIGNEKKYLTECIDSTFVSYVGKFVSDFEEHVKRLTGARNAIAMVNGTSALMLALIVAGVEPGDEVITQALTFVATANAVKHCGAEPIFIDVARDTMGMCPESLSVFLEKNAELRGNGCINKMTGKRIAACVPMHTFGHPVKIDSIIDLCKSYRIPVVEDSAEGLGSMYQGKHVGMFGVMGILSFNGNKPVTTGGGGMIITDDDVLAERIRHKSTTAKVKHPWSFYHDEVGYNLRMPNVNAAVGCAQMEKISYIFENKRELAMIYREFFSRIGLDFFIEPADSRANYWLNAVIFNDSRERDRFLEFSNGNGVQTRPVWTLMNKLPMFRDCTCTELHNAVWLEERVVNIPSSVRI